MIPTPSRIVAQNGVSENVMVMEVEDLMVDQVDRMEVNLDIKEWEEGLLGSIWMETWGRGVPSGVV